MTDCCVSSDQSSLQDKKHLCPVDGKMYSEVSLSTILKHIKKPWLRKLTEQKYYFCDNPECNVIYFGKDNSVIKQSDLRTKVGIKDCSDNAILCYCFDVNKQDFNTNPDIKSYIVTQTVNKNCSCESLNPSGKCCIKDFQK